MLTDEQLLRYSRQILLKNFDIEGQERLQESHVAVIGCGGLGAAALPILVGSGIGQLTIVDFDNVDITNLHRQTFYKMEDIETSKVISMKERLEALNPDVDIYAIEKRVGIKELNEICKNVDCILDCTDNFEVRQSLNRAALEAKTPLISGAAVRYEGQLTVYDFRDEDSACYACLFDGKGAIDGGCAFFGVFPPVVHIIGATQAQEALKLLLNIGKIATHQLRIYNGLENSWKSFNYQKNPRCRVCNHF